MKSQKPTVAQAAVGALCLLLLGRLGCHEPPSVETYCRTTAEIAAKEVGFLDKVAALTEKYSQDDEYFRLYCSAPKYYLDQRAIYRKEFDDGRAAVYSAHNTTAADCQAYADANQAAITAYWAANPEARTAMEVLSGRIKEVREKLKVPCHCLLAIAAAAQKRGQLEEQIAVARGYAGTLEAFLELERADRADRDARIEALCKSFDTSTQEYGIFGGRNGRTLQQYLDGHPAIKRAIDDLSGRVRTLMQEYEGLRAGIVAAAGRRPPE